MEAFSHEKPISKTTHIEYGEKDTGSHFNQKTQDFLQEKQHAILHNEIVPNDVIFEPELILEQRELKEKKAVPPVFLMDPKTRDLYIENGEYELKKMMEKMMFLAEKESERDHAQGVSPEIGRIMRKSDILEGQRNFYETLRSKIHGCMALYQSNMLDQIRIFSSDGRIVIEDVTLVAKEQKKSIDLATMNKERELQREMIAQKTRQPFQSGFMYKKELETIDDKNKVLTEREEYLRGELYGEQSILAKRVAIETTVAEVLQSLTALGEHIPKRFAQEPVILQTILYHVEKLLQSYIAYTKLPVREQEMLEEYKRIEVDQLPVKDSKERDQKEKLVREGELESVVA